MIASMAADNTQSGERQFQGIQSNTIRIAWLKLSFAEDP